MKDVNMPYEQRQLTEEEIKIRDDLFRELGQAYYEGAFEDPLPQLLPIFDEITALLKQPEPEPEEALPEQPHMESTGTEIFYREEVGSGTISKSPEKAPAKEAPVDLPVEEPEEVAVKEVRAEPEAPAPVEEAPFPVMSGGAANCCPQCGVYLPEGASFCEECGYMVEKAVAPEPVRPKPRFCPKCGNQLGENARFCGKCGTSLG